MGPRREVSRHCDGPSVSIHKSQGSEYPAVVIPLATQHYMLPERNLLYTGVTRGRKLVVIVGQPKAIAIAGAYGTLGTTTDSSCRPVVGPCGKVIPSKLADRRCLLYSPA
jgi:UvrD-like helicase family protein